MDRVPLMPFVCPALKKALDKYANQSPALQRDPRGAQKAFAKLIGIPPNYITRFLNPNEYSKTIVFSTWQKLYPHIKEFLPTGFDPFSTSEPKYNTDTSLGTEKIIEPTKSLPHYLGQIINGQINVYGVPNERISSVINAADFLSEDQKKYLIYEIFKTQ